MVVGAKHIIELIDYNDRVGNSNRDHISDCGEVGL